MRPDHAPIVRVRVETKVDMLFRVNTTVHAVVLYISHSTML